MKDDFTFEGFEPANTTPVPDILFDVLLPHLNEAQLKVMLYIIRRTLGFKKTTDAISLNQFRWGITRRDGTKLDNGCGLKNFTTISKALKELEQMNCIESDKRKTEEGNDLTTVYRIRFRGTTQNVVPTTDNVVGVLRKKEDGTTRNVGRVLRKKESQDTDSLQETVLQETVKQGGVGETESPPQDTPPPEKPQSSKSSFSGLRSQWIAAYGPYGDSRWDNDALRWIAEQGGSFDDIKLLYPLVADKRPEKIKNAWYKLSALKKPARADVEYSFAPPGYDAADEFNQYYGINEKRGVSYASV